MQSNFLKNSIIIKIILVLVGIYIALSVFKNFLGVSTLSVSPGRNDFYGGIESTDVATPLGQSIGSSSSRNILPPTDSYAPQVDTKERIVIQDSNLSLLVANVVETRNNIINKTEESGGYMVTTSTSNPEDAPTSKITVRVPTEKLNENLEYFRSLSIKVVSENLQGKDVTDQYVDLEKRLETLEATKSKFENILEQATEIEDITNLTQQILYYQDQIDSIKGQQEAITQNAKLSKITIYLSTDEIALPYAPSETFRPGVIFKLAVRSLIGTLRDFAAFAIWAGVYAVIWIPILLTVYFVRRRLKQNKSGVSPNSKLS